jgi:hypothetical protein
MANADDVQRDPHADRQVASPYTHVEHLVISSWLARTKKLRLRSLSDVSVEQRPLADVLASLGLAQEPKQYDRLDAAVGQILLRDIAGRLPRLKNGRDCRDRASARARDPSHAARGRLLFAPQHLFTIVWPSQTPDLAGPVAYFRVWVPGFNCFVVTASEPTDGPHGYCDFALGSFADVPESQGLAGQIIYGDWLTQFGFWWCKHRPEVSAGGIVSVEFADQLAERAWVTEHRVFYSRKLTPQAPRAIRSGLLPVKRSLCARVLRFRRDSKNPVIANSNGDPI